MYVFTGFLDAGKTKFIQETLEDPRFNAGERTLLLVFEEGEEEYDLSAFPKKNVYLEVLDQDAVTPRQLAAMQKKYRAERVVAELNGMKLVGDLYTRFPENWAVAQEVMFADASTILQYNANMRNLVVDKLSGCEMVVFNRVRPGEDTMPLHKLARAVNRRVDILYESTDGTSAYDETEDPLPFDIHAPVIEVQDEDYGLWYRDVSEEPEKYTGKTVRFAGPGCPASPGPGRHFCTGPVCDDLLCGGYPVLRRTLSICRGCKVKGQELGSDYSEDFRRKASAVPGGRGPDFDGPFGRGVFSCGTGSCDLLVIVAKMAQKTKNTRFLCHKY